MSTHFRPRPTSLAPESPARPTTAHSTIRTVPPSPPDSRDGTCRPVATFHEEALQIKRDHTPPQEELSSFAKNNWHTDEQIIENTSLTAAPKTNDAAPGRNSPEKARSKSPRKQPISTPVKAPSKTFEKQRAAKHQATSPDEITPCPDMSTPTPTARKQKRPDHFPPSICTTPQPNTWQPQPLHDKSPQKQTAQNASCKKTKQHSTLPQTKRFQQSMPRNPSLPSTPTAQRGSVSAHSNDTGGSAKSRHSIFSTPGRDELERKKALIEPDQGPFGCVTSIQDLDRERKRISGATVESQKEGVAGKGKKACGSGCVVM